MNLSGNNPSSYTDDLVYFGGQRSRPQQAVKVANASVLTLGIKVYLLVGF